MSKIKMFSLGGLNESGKNLYVIEVNEDIFVFDAGLKYANDYVLGVDYIIPNYDYLKENEDRIKGIFLSHGHDEAMGAIPDMLTDLHKVKIYGTKFTMELLRTECEEEGIPTEQLVELKPHKKMVFGENSIFPISMTHSIPDSVGYVLNTKDGAIFYTGNYVFDPTVTGAYQMDIGKLAYVGKQGVLCLLSESLYAEKEGFTSPSHRIYPVIREMFEKHEGRILCNVFSSQIYRIQEILNAVRDTDRKVVILGKRLERTILRAIDMGYIIFDKERLLSLHHISDEGIIVLISDEREKPFTNILRIVKGYDKFVKLKEEDTVIFASQVYEGMEKTSTKIFDDIARIGCELLMLPTKKYLNHHASKEDLMLMLDLMMPKYYFPIMGEYRHQVENAKAAILNGMKEENVLLRLNGEMVVFEDGVLKEADEHIKTEEILIDGKETKDIGELVLKDRESLGDNGVLIVCVTTSRETKQVLAGPEIITRGFIYVKDHFDLIKEAKEISLSVIKENTKENYIEFNKVKMGIRDKLGKYLYEQTESKPMILIMLQEV